MGLLISAASASSRQPSGPPSVAVSVTLLIAVSPGQRVLEIVTGDDSAIRIPDRSCAIAAASMTASFGSGDLTGGIVNGLRILSDQARHPRLRR